VNCIDRAIPSGLVNWPHKLEITQKTDIAFGTICDYNNILFNYAYEEATWSKFGGFIATKAMLNTATCRKAVQALP